LPDNAPTASQTLTPHIQLIQMGRTHVISRTVYAAAKLGLADQLASGQKSAAELGGSMKVHARSLHRVMRTLASLGVLTEQAEQRFALAAILATHAAPHGILFDRPHVIKDAPALLDERDVSDRVTIEPGDFFQRVPAGADAYILSHIIHDWDDEQCLAILGHIRKAMKPTGCLLIVEMVLSAGDTPHPGKMLDMVMLAQTGGEERSEAEYRLLLANAGFRLTRVVPTNSAASIVEARTDLIEAGSTSLVT
jgi:hypothetical protein